MAPTALAAIPALSYLGGRRPEQRWHPQQRLRTFRTHWRHASALSLCWQPPLYPSAHLARLPALNDYLRQLERRIHPLTAAQQRFVVLGGDHANAMGIWRGVRLGLPPQMRLGLLWIDAHLDSHTFASTPSGNIHGMPVAALLGAGDPPLQRLCPPAQRPEIVFELYGVHSYEAEEAQLLNARGVSVTTRQQIRRQGIDTTLAAALSRLARQCDVYGVSLDLDALHYPQAPAVATPVVGGLPVEPLCQSLRHHLDPARLVGVEIAEFYPSLDQQQRTQITLAQLLSAMLG